MIRSNLLHEIQGSDIFNKKGADFMKGSCHYDNNSNRWFIQIYWEGEKYRFWKHPQSGEPFWVKKSAEKQLNRMRTEVDEGSFHPRFWKPNSPLLVKEYFEGWLSAIDVSDKTRQDYRGYFANHIIPRIGDMDIRRIRYKHLTQMHKDLSLSNKGKYNVIGALRTMLRWAYRSEDIKWMPPFPVLSFTLPEIDYLTMDQQEKILRFIPEADRPIFEFGMEYGFRTQEVRAIQKDCIKEDEVVIKRSFSGNRLQQTTKTKLIRHYPLTKNAAETLKKTKPHLSPFVFVRADGKPYTNKNLNSIWRKACGSAGIKIKLQNALRHSLGCQLLDQGEDLELVRDVLGHTKTEMTRRYAKRSPASIKNALEKRRNIINLEKKEAK